MLVYVILLQDNTMSEEGKHVESDNGEEEDDEEQSAFTRLQILGKAQATLAVGQIAMSVAVLVLSSLSRKDNDSINIRDVFSGTIGVCSGVVGFIGGAYKKELPTRLYFIFQLWMLSVITMYLYVTVSSETTMESKCNPHGTFSQSSNSDDCHGGVARNRAKLSFGAMGLLLTLATCVVSFDFEDALDDYSDELKADRLMEAMEAQEAELHEGE